MSILIVDDDKDVAVGVARGLAANGHTTEIAADGLLGVAMAETGNYDLIILDILLPGLNGFQVCSTLRSAGNWTPILMLTAKSGEWDEAEGLETGADDYLVKPFSMMVLNSRVSALLRRPRSRNERPFVAGDLRLDPIRHRCWRGETEIQLTAREMEVLAFLLARKGETVPKQTIVEGVWGMDFRGDANIVEVYIGHLRRKIDEPFERRSIETVRGVGYRLAADGETR